MRGRAALMIAFFGVLSLITLQQPAASAELAVGTVIDKTNAEQAEGLIPDPVLNWIKKGEGSMTVGEVPYELSDYLPPAAKAHMESNKGKYGVDADNLMVDLKTGKLPDFVDGMPFPEIDPEDPKAAVKIMYNKHYYSYAVGPIQVPFQTSWVGRKTGFEREIIMDYWTYLLDGYPPAREESNPENVEMHSLIIALAPYDIKGTNILLWRYRNDKLDSTFAYVPAIRRVRRMSPANRSDSFLGSDFCVDDAWGYGGKIQTFNWKLIEKKDQLVPFLAGPPIKLIKNDVGEWVSQSGDRTITYGYKTEGWQGAPWWPTSGITYINRPTYILECSAKDKYYNYGPQQLWVDASLWTPTYKVISDRSGAYWKVEWQALNALQTEDKSYQTSGLANMMAFDDRSEHASVLVLTASKNSTRYLAQHDRNDFSLGGFQKLCK
jgi:hypothetical protein